MFIVTLFTKNSTPVPMLFNRFVLSLLIFVIPFSLQSQTCEGGTVSTVDGDSTINTIAGDGMPDEFSFINQGASNTVDYGYVITDENNVIIAIQEQSVVDFEGAGPGTCRVWGLSFSGNFTAEPGDTASAVTLASECFDLSDNFVTVVRAASDTTELSGGMVTTEDGATEVDVCVNDGVADVITFRSEGASGENFTYVVTDDNNVILAVPDSNIVDFEGAGAGVCRVWGLSFTGNITAQPGDTASAVALTDGEFDLSDNFVTVNRTSVNGGTVATVDGETEVSTIAGDGVADEFEFVSEGADTTASFTFVVTDDSNVILAVPGGNTVDFEGAGPGICRVWGLSFTGNVLAQPGDTASVVALTDGCFDLSDNFVIVNRADGDTSALSGGRVITVDEQTEVDVCVNDGVADVIAFNSEGAIGENFTFVVTDDNNVILAVPDSNIVDFEGAGAGVCRVWGLSFTGNITAQPGDTASAVALTDGEFDLSDNFVTVNRTSVNGGTVATVDGETEVSTIAGDGVADEFEFVSEGADTTASFTFVVTDDSNVILAVPGGNTVDFEGAGPGICRVWGLSFTGNVLAQPGDTASVVALTDGCFDLSDNFVTVVRMDADTSGINGGMVTTENGETEAEVCVNDGMPDVIAFNSMGASGDNFTFVVTDDNNVILAVPDSNIVDFEGAGAGVCRVWGLSFTGNITAQPGDTASAVALTDGEFDLSDNFVTVNRTSVNGGTVATVDGETEVSTIAGDGMPDEIAFASEGADTTANFTFVVTDDNNVILALPGGNTVDFEGAGPGICRVWGLSFTGNVLAQAGDTASSIALTDGCFDLSDNFVTVVRMDADTSGINGGMVTTENGETEAEVCVNDGMPDVIAFNSMGASGDNFTFVVTDDNNVILAVPDSNIVDFEGAGAGVCRVWGLSFTGNITAQPGDTASAVALTDGEFDLSDNFVTVNRTSVNGGTVATVDGETEVSTIAGDGMPDEIAFASEGADTTANFTFVVTDDNNVILALPGGNTVDFEGAGPGICRVWGLSFTGNVLAQAGDTASSIALTDGCFDLSDNFVTVTRTEEDTTDMGDKAITGFVLVDSDTDMDIMMINDGDVININTLPVPNINIRANASSDSVESVLFTVNGNFYTIENFVPYAIGGDFGGDYNATPFFQVGTYTLMATPYCEDGAEGDAGTPLTITFELVDGEPADLSLAVSSFTLWDADADDAIGELMTGAMLSADDATGANISANTEGEVGSVVFTLNGEIFNVENAAPFALAGDVDGDVLPIDLPVGEHTLTATPYSESDGSGTEGQSLTIIFSVSGDTSASQGISINPASIRKSKEMDLAIYPNPVQREIFISTEKDMEDRLEITIMNLNGDIMHKTMIDKMSIGINIKMDMESLPQGIYIMRIQNENHFEIRRILKQ